MSKQADPKRAWADELAALLAIDPVQGKAELKRLKDSEGSTEPEEDRVSIHTNKRPRAIQIWRPIRLGGDLQFIRPEPGPYSDHYAQRLSIPAEKPAGLRRICLFGESAAAGYLYAPHLTPSKVLQAQLCSITGEQSCEVLDFARTNETLSNLVATVEAALQLSPDLLVLYAGNNWNLLETAECSPYYPNEQGRTDYAEALKQGGLDQVAEWSARRMLSLASTALEAIAELANSNNLPMVVVVPEVNLGDWQNRQPAPWLPADGIARWYHHHDLARDALDQGQPKVALDHAMEMLQLDAWSGSTAYRLMSLARLQLADHAGAIQAARAEVDNVLYSTQAMLGSPQAGSMVQALLRSFATRHEFMLADLPQVFSDYLHGEMPDRRLFLDYCHLSVEGIELAMASVSAQILSLSGQLDANEGWRTVHSRVPAADISPQASATAMFGAAMHTAHRMASVTAMDELLEYWCNRAIETWPGIASSMQQVLAMRSSDLGPTMHAAELANQASECPLNPQHGWHYDYADIDLVNAIVNVLQRCGIDYDLPGESTISDQCLDLLLPRHQASPLNRFFPELMVDSAAPRRAWQRFAWPRCRFAFQLPMPAPLSLILTARLAEGPASVKLILNGTELAKLELKTNWQRHRVHVGEDALRVGSNVIELVWPIPDVDGAAWLNQAQTLLSQGREADVHPVFGELARLELVFGPADKLESVRPEKALSCDD
ncbi:MAG: hypothetical protein DHS20C11_04680 [Lysobacteraceae bacterium]|nr:MAG: hypothetical protein DHS20C11_04680 [Xanthomonadaceae bacterium]